MTPERNRVPPFSVRHHAGCGHAVFDGRGNRVSQWFAEPAGLVRRAAEMNAAARKKAGPRPCLCCGAEFPSQGIHNRMCDDCRRSGGPIDSTLDQARRHSRAQA